MIEYGQDFKDPYEGLPFSNDEPDNGQDYGPQNTNDEQDYTPYPEPQYANLTRFLDGTYKPPKPSVGIVREDGKRILYPGKWHTLIGPTASGKSWFAAQAVFDELNEGSHVIYAHFEEATPAGTVGRLLQLGLTAEMVLNQFHWLDMDLPADTYQPAEISDRLAVADAAIRPTLVILDGINAACSKFGLVVNEPIAVGTYRNALVSPFTRLNAAVLSLGHPPKASDRQKERHGFGSTAWLDEVDGVGFRILASKTKPIAHGKTGYSNIYTVKDRAGQVEALGELSKVADGWYELGSLQIDDTKTYAASTTVRLMRPLDEDDKKQAKTDRALEMLDHLQKSTGEFPSVNKLQDILRKSGFKFSNGEERELLYILEGLDLIELTTTRGGGLSGIVLESHGEEVRRANHPHDED